MSRLSTFKKAFASTLGFNVIARGMSAITLVVLLRALSTEDFAFIVLLLNILTVGPSFAQAKGQGLFDVELRRTSLAQPAFMSARAACLSPNMRI